MEIICLGFRGWRERARINWDKTQHILNTYINFNRELSISTERIRCHWRKISALQGREESLHDSRVDGLAAAAQLAPITGLTNYTDMLLPLYLQHVFTHFHDWKKGSGKRDNVRRAQLPHVMSAEWPEGILMKASGLQQDAACLSTSSIYTLLFKGIGSHLLIPDKTQHYKLLIFPSL